MSCLLGLFFWFPIILSSTSNKKRNINISIVQKEKKKCTWGSRHDASQVPSPAVAANVDDGGGNGGVDVGSCVWWKERGSGRNQRLQNQGEPQRDELKINIVM